MKKYIKMFIVIILTSIIIIYCLNNEKEIEKNKAIFNIVGKELIDLDGSEIQNNEYKKIEKIKNIGKGFFINNKGYFFTNKHIFEEKFKKYWLKIGEEKYEFEIKKIYDSKDLVLAKVKNYDNNIFFFKIIQNSNIKIGSKVFVIKDNKKINGKVLNINKEIKDLKLRNLIKTNIKLEPGDSGSPLLNKDMKVIGINTAISVNEKTSFAEKIDYKIIKF